MVLCVFVSVRACVLRLNLEQLITMCPLRGDPNRGRPLQDGTRPQITATMSYGHLRHV